jgi:hypothetical protein
MRSPNPRLQRTRVRPSGGRSPLSRQPLGGRIISLATVAGVVALACRSTGAAGLFLEIGPWNDRPLAAGEQFVVRIVDSGKVCDSRCFSQ